LILALRCRSRVGRQRPAFDFELHSRLGQGSRGPVCPPAPGPLRIGTVRFLTVLARG
jgi:hypothetical protein